MNLALKQTRSTYQPQPQGKSVDLWRTYHQASAADIRALQRHLNAQGAQLKVDGRYGANTRAALVKARGDVSTSTHTPKPTKKPDFWQRNLPALFPADEPEPVPQRPSVRLGRDFRRASSNDVRALQRYLNAQGHTLEVDGRYGSKTEAALIDQRRQLYGQRGAYKAARPSSGRHHAAAAGRQAQGAHSEGDPGAGL